MTALLRTDTPQTPQLEPIERSPIQDQLDLFALAPSCEESSWSYHTMFNYRETQRSLQAQNAMVDNKRITHNRLRFYLTIAGSQFKKAENLRCEELGLFARIPEFELDAWLSKSYHESTRAFSMDAAAWTDWATPACPWTTWKASWNGTGIHVLPPTKPSNMFPHRMLERFLKVFQLRPSLRTAQTPRYVRTYRRAPPSIRPRPAVCKSPTPAQGGFIENLDESVRYHDMLHSDGRKGALCKKKSVDALATETMIESQKNHENIDEANSSSHGSDVAKDDAAARERGKWDMIRGAIKGVLCTAPGSPRPRTRFNKARPEDARRKAQ